jgi:peptidoglycan/LPS O-acetylase OafA/YrhL
VTSPVSQSQVPEPRPPGSAPSNGESSNGATTNGATTNGASTPARLGYIPALDGVRALAVAAVLVYHGELGWFSGGFLGVDVFFVLSGYLITSVLLDAWRRNGGHLGLARFYVHRARRLLPALVVMITVTCAYVVVFLPDEASKLRGGVVASFGYVTNWYLIFHQQSYFSAIGRQPMLQHLWSLAIEEQFYLLWPLLLGLALKFWRPSRIKLAVTILGGAAVSALLMALLYRSGGDPSRVYYGTDTHSSGLLIGAGMAVLLPPWQLRGKIGKRAPMALDVIGLTALLVLVWCFVNISEFDSSLYRGGYLVFACVAALVVLVAVHPATTITAGLLGTSPMVWIGKRSYGIYLWHWPVFLVTRPGLDIPLTGIPLFTFRVAISVGLAAASYRFVEVPIRSGALGRRLSALRHAPMLQRRRVRVRLAFAGALAVVTTALLGIGLAVAQPAPRPPGFPAKPANIAITTTTAPRGSAPTSAPAAATVPDPAHSAPNTTLTPIPNARVTAIGDSVMLGAQTSLRRFLGDRLQMDANVSRHFSEGLDVVRRLHDAGQLGDEVVIHLGTNGSIPEDQLDEMLRLLSGVKRVVVVNTRVDRPWEQPDNDAIAAAVPRYPNAVLLDWYSAASQHPEYLVQDGVHLSEAGQAYYSLVMASKL